MPKHCYVVLLRPLYCGGSCTTVAFSSATSEHFKWAVETHFIPAFLGSSYAFSDGNKEPCQ